MADNNLDCDILFNLQILNKILFQPIAVMPRVYSLNQS